MARAVNRLTDKTVKALAEHGRHADGDGLNLIVDAKGKRWMVFILWLGKRREMGLGAYPAVSLGEARTAAKAARKLASEGTDPIAARTARKAGDVPTLGEVAHDLIAELQKGWKGKGDGKSADSWTRSIDIYAKPIKDKPVNTIDTEACLKVLRPIWMTKPETAGKLRYRLERWLDAARAAGYITGPWENPARWKGHLAGLLSKRPKLTRGHHAAMPFAAVPAFMPRLAEREGISARALEWTILTVAREDMTIGARVKEIDREAMIWTIPGERMKGPEAPDFRVPITPQALAVLDRAWPPDQPRKPDDFLFPSRSKRGSGISNTAMDRMLQVGLGEPFTPHGFRSSFRDWGAERTHFARELLEQSLAHVVGDETERAYRRGDALEKRRKVLAAWASYCLTPVRTGNVVPMRA